MKFALRQICKIKSLNGYSIRGKAIENGSLKLESEVGSETCEILYSPSR